MLPFAAALAGVLCFCTVAAAQEFYLRPQEHVLFFGDPTPSGLPFEELIESFALTRFPQWHAEFRYSLASELNSEVLATYSPTLVVTGPFERDGARPQTVEKLYSLLSGRSVRLTLLRPINGFVLPAGAVVLDVDAFVSAQVGKVRAIDPALAATIQPPGGPVGAAGHLLIAQAVLQAWHAQALVSAVEINALHGIVTRSENTSVRDLENGRVIAWSQDDRALPLPIDFSQPGIALTARCSEFVNLLDQEILRITGMAAERYRLTIDGEPQGEFHRDQLDAGLNLSLMATPMWRQAMEVHALTRKHQELANSRSRLFQVPAGRQRSARWKSELEAIDAAEAELVAAQRSKARPKTHDYELQPVER